ncbi:winged helix-turn-helix transcriptional regulator [Micromonospora humida]|uniref:winged helix-turn-helix transcriptional regulator n=1 Tax=Micromonospora humida TaxID=2809018 RepID=UPI00340FCD59
MTTRTAAERRAEAAVAYDAFVAQCPSRELLARISDKWVVLVLAALRTDGSHRFGADCAGTPRPMRYSELSRLLAGVSQKMLTQTLRTLERDGLVSRTATATVPVTVTYELTDLGFSLHETMRALKAWAETHLDDVHAHRAAYDARHPAPAARPA